jgi:hypothetical protein
LAATFCGGFKPRRDTISKEAPMTTPANAIKDEVRLLVDYQIETLKQPTPITSSQLDGYHSRSKRVNELYQELDRIGSRSVVERLEMAS